MRRYPSKNIIYISPRRAEWEYWARSHGLNTRWQSPESDYRWYKLGRSLDRLLLQHDRIDKVVLLSIAGINDGYQILEVSQWCRQNNIDMELLYLE